MNRKLFLIPALILGLTFLGCGNPNNTQDLPPQPAKQPFPKSHIYTAQEIEDGIKAGEIAKGYFKEYSEEELKEPSKDEERISLSSLRFGIKEITPKKIPLQIFRVSTEQHGFAFTLLVDKGKFVIVHHDGGFELKTNGDKKVLTYRYYMGSGICLLMQVEYVIGSGVLSEPKCIESPWHFEDYEEKLKKVELQLVPPKEENKPEQPKPAEPKKPEPVKPAQKEGK